MSFPVRGHRNSGGWTSIRCQVEENVAKASEERQIILVQQLFPAIIADAFCEYGMPRTCLSSRESNQVATFADNFHEVFGKAIIVPFSRRAACG